MKPLKNHRPLWTLAILKLEFAIVALVLLTGCAQLPNWDATANIVEDKEANIDDEQLDVRFGVTRIVERNGNIEDARAMYLQIIQSNPDYVPALHRLGVIAVRQEDLERAIEYLELANKLDSDSAEILGDLGYAYLLRSDLENAIEFLDRGFRLAPEDPRISNNLGLALGYVGNSERALMMFRRCNPESQAVTNLGFVFSQRGEFAKAAEYFHRALELDPSLEQAANGLVEVDRYLKSIPTDQNPVVKDSIDPNSEFIAEISER